MKTITLQRFKTENSKIVTFGKLTFDWLPESKDVYTLELPWRDNKPFISCIPQGIYNCKRYSSSKYPKAWQICNVPDRDRILIHAGNFASVVNLQRSYKSDTEGCILVGLGIEESIPMITRSYLAINYLLEILQNENFTLIVKN